MTDADRNSMIRHGYNVDKETQTKTWIEMIAQRILSDDCSARVPRVASGPGMLPGVPLGRRKLRPKAQGVPGCVGPERSLGLGEQWWETMAVQDFFYFLFAGRRMR
jgi:hypothetical protein